MFLLEVLYPVISAIVGVLYVHICIRFDSCFVSVIVGVYIYVNIA